MRHWYCVRWLSEALTEDGLPSQSSTFRWEPRHRGRSKGDTSIVSSYSESLQEEEIVVQDLDVRLQHLCYVECHDRVVP